MSEVDQEELDALGYRFSGMVAIAKLLATHSDAPSDVATALGCIADTLSDLSVRLDGLVERVQKAAAA
jgi:hypothetical protein